MRPIISIVVQTLRQQFGMFRLVVDVAHQGVFDADSPFGSQIIIMRSVEHLFGVETLVHGHKFIAQFIARRVQGYCETYWDAFFGQFPDARHHANGGNRDVTCGDAEAFGRHGTNLADCAQDGFIVAHWFAHAHEHDVAQSSGASGHFTVTHGLRGHTNLLNDFACGHVPGQSQLSSGAEWATHAAADLAGNAKRGSGGITHQYGFDQRPIKQAPQRFDGGASIGDLACHLMDEFREESFSRVGASCRRKIGKFFRIDIKMAIVMISQLFDPEFRQSKFLGLTDTFLFGHIGEMQWRLATAGMVFRQHIPEGARSASRSDACFRLIIHGIHGYWPFLTFRWPTGARTRKERTGGWSRHDPSLRHDL